MKYTDVLSSMESQVKLPIAFMNMQERIGLERFVATIPASS